MGGGLILEHRAFPLRPAPEPGLVFKGTYREAGWRRCGEMSAADGLVYNAWPHQDHYPNWSLPALEAAKCVERVDRDALDRVHLRLFRAFFTESRNIADPEEVVRIVAEEGVDRDRFLAEYRAGAGREAVIEDYRTAVEEGVRAIPTVVFPASGRVLVGLADLAQYRAAAEEAARC